MSSLTTTLNSQKVAPLNRLWWVALVAAGASALGNLLLFFIAAGLGVSFLMPLEPGSSELAPLPAVIVVVASALPAIFATILYALLGKFVRRPILIFWIISAVVLVLSFGLPIFNLPATVDTPTVIALELMHIVSAATIVGVLTGLGRKT